MKRSWVVLALLHMALLQGSWIVQEEYLSPLCAEFDCHSSSLVEIDEGTLCAVWKGGPGSGLSNTTMSKNVGIWISHCQRGTWTEPHEIVTLPHTVSWNPVLVQLPSKELLLFFRVGSQPRLAVSYVKRSWDGGRSWSEGEVLMAGCVGPTKNKPIVTAKGTLIAPSSGAEGEQPSVCWIEISRDTGKQWKRFGPIRRPGGQFGVNEPALFYDRQGRLRMVCRDRALKEGGKGSLWMGISLDHGETWSPLQETGLPNPDSGIDAVDLGGGEILLLYNHSLTERRPLNVALSLDGGDSWSKPLVLSPAGEFPAGIRTSEGLVHITFAEPQQSGQRRIKHVVIDPSQLP